MVDCKKCGMWFRDNYKLNRHMSRLKPCDGKINKELKICNEENLQNSTSDLQNSTLDLQNSTLDLQNSTLDLQNSTPNLQNSMSNKCEFCLNTFFNKYTKNRHQEICKFKEDPVRLLEIQNNVSAKEAKSKYECRFCNKDFSRKSVLHNHFETCKERDDYYKELQVQKVNIQNQNKIQNQTTIQNQNQTNNQNQINNQIQNQANNSGSVNTLNNGTINNYNINVFGQENTDHIQAERLIQMLRDLSLDYSKDQVYLSAGEFINLVNKYIREVPENDNFSIPDPKGVYAEIKTETGMEKVPIDRYLEKSFKSSAKTILSKKETINEQNERVFKSETNKSIFSEVKGFADNGFRHTPKNCVGTPRQVKSAYKVGMLNRAERMAEVDF
jgi:hypothetical protein